MASDDMGAIELLFASNKFNIKAITVTGPGVV